MRYVLNGPLKECRNKRRIDKTRTETTVMTRTSIHTDKTKHQIERIFLLKQLISINLHEMLYHPGCRLAASNVTRNGCRSASYRR